MMFDRLLHAPLERNGSRSEMILRMPAVAEVFGLFLPRQLRTDARMAVLGPAEIKRFVHAIDGREMNIEQARAIFNVPSLRAQYSTSRNRLLATLSASRMLPA